MKLLLLKMRELRPESAKDVGWPPDGIAGPLRFDRSPASELDRCRNTSGGRGPHARDLLQGGHVDDAHALERAVEVKVQPRGDGHCRGVP